MASDDEEGLTREEAKRILRRLELEAYSSIITAFRAQGDLNREKKQALSDLATHLSISNERHRAEVRRVVNDDSLNTVAECLHGVGTVTEWSFEGKRLVSLTPRLVPQTVFTAKATHTADAVSQENSKLPIKKGSSPNPRDRALLISSKFDKFEEKYKIQDDNLLDLAKSDTLAKGQDNDKARKKKKQNQASNKILKPSKLNLQPKTECRSSSSNGLNENLLSPSSAQRTILPETSRGSFHQKPIILQRSPHKAAPSSRPHSAESSVSSLYSYNQRPTLSSPQSVVLGSSSVVSSSTQQRQVTADSKGVNAAANMSIKSSQGLDSSNNTYIVQKMKFKTPVVKSKAKPVKPKAGTPLSRPSAICGSESLNVLATSAVVPIAPISPVKSVIPSSMGQNTVVSNADGTEESRSDAVKVIQMQKSTNFGTSVNTTPKSFVVVSSSTGAKAGNTQRVVALSNVPISGNQQLKIASIPNVLQQSGAKIVSIAKSMPMTTGFKMIAVTTVVPGSTQVKTVYIATPIMSVTKTSSQLQGTMSNQTTATKLLHTLVSSSATPVRPAQTDVSPSNLSASGKPSLGVLNSRGFTPPTTSSLSSVVKASVCTNTSSVVSTMLSTTSMATTSVTTCKAETSMELPKPTVSSKEETKTVSIQNKTLEKFSPTSNVISSNSVKVAASEAKTPHTNVANGKPLSFENKTEISSADKTKCQQSAEADTINPSGNALNEVACDNADETILLAGEKFLADLAAKFSKNTNEDSPSKVGYSESDRDASFGSGTFEGDLRGRIEPKTESKNSEFTSRIHVQHDESESGSIVGSKVIVRKIGDEYNSPLNLSPDLEEEKRDVPVAVNDQVGLAVGRLKKNLESVQKLDIKSNEVMSHTINEAEKLDNLDSESLTVLRSSEVFKSPTGSASFDSSLDQNKEVADVIRSDVKARDSSSSQMKTSPGKRANFCDNQVQPRNVFTSFCPANGNADEDQKTDSKSLRVLSPLIPSPVNLSAEHSQHSLNSAASPVRSPFAMEPISYKKVSSNETNMILDNNLLTGYSRDGPTGSCRQNLNAVFPGTSPKELSDRTELSVPTVYPSYLNEGQSCDKFSCIKTTCTDSITSSKNPAYISPLNSPNSKTSPLSRRNSDKKSAVLSQSDMKQIVENEGNNEPYGQQANHSQQVQLNNRGDLLPDEQNLLKHSPRTSKGSVRSTKFDSASSEAHLSSERMSNSSGELPCAKESHNIKVNVTDIGRATSNKRKSESVLSGGWIKGALSLLHKVSRFRGPNKLKGEMNAASWFTRPVDPAEAPGYYKVIKKPMDFSTVRKKLEGGAYKDFTEFYSDMHLIKSNCYTYNPAEHLARKDCDLVFTFFEEECYKLLQKQQNIIESPSKKSKVDVKVQCSNSY